MTRTRHCDWTRISTSTCQAWWKVCENPYLRVNQVSHSQKPLQDTERSPELTTMQLHYCIPMEDEIFVINDSESDTKEAPAFEVALIDNLQTNNTSTNETRIKETTNET